MKQTKQNKENALRNPGASALIFGSLDLWFCAPFLANEILPQRGSLCCKRRTRAPNKILWVICDELLTHLGAVAICSLRHAMEKSDNFLNDNNRPG